MYTGRLAALLLLVVSASCDSHHHEGLIDENSATPIQPSPKPTTATRSQPSAGRGSKKAKTLELILEAEGLRVVDGETGSTRPLPFGSPTENTKRILAAVLGQSGSEGRNAECGAGALAYVDYGYLMVWFKEGEFVGWESDGGDLTTADGIGVGSTRAALQQSGNLELPDSTVGTEFSANGLGGLLNSSVADARVTNLWAGVTCIFR